MKMVPRVAVAARKTPSTMDFIIRRSKRFRGKKVSITFSLAEDMIAWIKSEAERRGLTQSDVAEDLLEHSIADYLKKSAERPGDDQGEPKKH